MTTGQSLSSRIREVFLNGKWIANTNYKELLENTGWQQAVQKAGDHNSIAAISFHINYYLGGLLKVFNGGPLDISDRFSYDMPPVQSAQDWNDLVQSLLDNAEAFALHVAAMTDEKLQDVFVKEMYGSYQRNIEGVLEHSYYHLGQISLLKKLLK